MKKINNTRILITGEAGYIGSNLVDHFLQQGHTVICPIISPPEKRENLFELF